MSGMRGSHMVCNEEKFFLVSAKAWSKGWLLLAQSHLTLGLLPLLPYITSTHTPPNIPVNTSKKWSKLTYPKTPILNETPIPQMPNYQTNLALKFHP